MTSAWAEFRQETFGDPYTVLHDGPHFLSLPSRWLEQPEHVTRMLELGLSEGDPVAAQAVGYLARDGVDVGALGSRLREALPQAQGTFRVRVAQALFALTDDQDLAQPICEVLTGDGHWSVKMDAAIALNLFAPAMKVVQALVHGVQDDQYLVRRHSAQTLLTLAGRHTTIEKVPDLWAMIRPSNSGRAWRLWGMMIRRGRDDRRAWQRAATELSRPWMK
jgi:hypothetical protein